MKNNGLYWVGIFAIVGLVAINLPPWFSPPAWGNTIFFKLILGVLLLATLWQWLWHPKTCPRQDVPTYAKASAGMDNLAKPSLQGPARWILYALGTVLGAFFLSSLFGLDPTHSFWGDPLRSWGFVNYLFYALFAVFLFWFLRQHSAWRLFWAIFATFGMIVVLVAFSQYLGAFSSFVLEQTRPSSVFGNPLHVSLFALPFSLIVLTLGLASDEKKWKIFFFASAIVFLFGILLTTNRSAFIGLGVGGFFFLLFYPKKAWFIKGMALIFLTAFAFLVFAANTADMPDFLKNSSVASRYWSRLSIKEALEDSRIDGYTITVRGAMDKPVLGYGMYNTTVVFDRYYREPTKHSSIRQHFTDSWWDSSHNLFIDVFSWAGIPGLLAFLAFLGTLFLSLWRVKRNNPELALIAHGIMTALLAYLVHAFFTFDVFATYLLFFSLVGYTLHLASLGDESKLGLAKLSSPWLSQAFQAFQRFRVPVFATAILLFVAFAWQENIKPFLVNININYAIEHGKVNDCEQMIWFMEKALSQGSTFLDSYLRVKYANQLSLCKRENPERSLEFTKRTYQLMEEAVASRPTFTRSWIALGSSSGVLANQADVGAIADTTPQHIDFFKQRTKEAFKKAQKLSPYRTEVYREWAKASIATKQYEEAEKQADQCIELDPSSGICQWYGALAAIGMGDKEKSNTRITEAENYGFATNTIEAKHQLIGAYLGAQNYAGVKEILTELIVIKPKESQYYIALLVAHIELKEYDLAQNVAHLIRDEFPNRSQEAEELLRNLP